MNLITIKEAKALVKISKESEQFLVKISKESEQFLEIVSRNIERAASNGNTFIDIDKKDKFFNQVKNISNHLKLMI